jgi:hypothetical protein
LSAKRILSTPVKASPKMAELILLRPLTRSTKVMGTSTILKPATRPRKLHLDLERIADEPMASEIDRTERFAR